MSRTRAAIEEDIARGLHAGAQIFVQLDGAVAMDEGIGLIRANVPFTSDTICPWFSSGKPIAAVAIARLWEQDLLQLDDKIIKTIPEFGQHGKDGITLRHILTHTGGFRSPNIDYDRPWDEMVRAVCATIPEPGWEPGKKAGYHAASSWMILGELIRRLGGQPFAAYVREHIFLPVGISDLWFGVDQDSFLRHGPDAFAQVYLNTGRTPPDVTRPAPKLDNLAHATPGGGLRCTARTLGRFYTMLLEAGAAHRPTGVPATILMPQTIEALVARHRVGLRDETFGRPVDWGLGFMINSAHYPDTPSYGHHHVPYGYSPHASARTFGHGGMQSSIGFADPEHGLVVAWMCNGLPGEPRHQERNTAINTAIYEDLGLT